MLRLSWRSRAITRSRRCGPGSSIETDSSDHSLSPSRRRRRARTPGAGCRSTINLASCSTPCGARATPCTSSCRSCNSTGRSRGARIAGTVANPDGSRLGIFTLARVDPVRLIDGPDAARAPEPTAPEFDLDRSARPIATRLYCCGGARDGGRGAAATLGAPQYAHEDVPYCFRSMTTDATARYASSAETSP